MVLHLASWDFLPKQAKIRLIASYPHKKFLKQIMVENAMSDLMELLELGFRHVGDFFLKGNKLQFLLNNHKNDTGSYAFVVDQTIKYVGVTKSALYTRMNGYRNPGPKQETNKRINPKIAEAGRVQVYFLPESKIAEFVTIIRRNQIGKQIPTDMQISERFLISMFKPEWNRQ